MDEVDKRIAERLGYEIQQMLGEIGDVFLRRPGEHTAIVHRVPRFVWAALREKEAEGERDYTRIQELLEELAQGWNRNSPRIARMCSVSQVFQEGDIRVALRILDVHRTENGMVVIVDGALPAPQRTEGRS